MKTKILVGFAALCCTSMIGAGNDAAYPKERIAQFVIENLDLTSLPSAFRLKKAKGKKTFAQYGFTAQSVGENEAVIEGTDGVRKLAIRVLGQTPSGIYVCMAGPEPNGGEERTQRVVLLKRKNPNALLKGRESFREFSACPVTGANDSPGDSNGGD